MSYGINYIYSRNREIVVKDESSLSGSFDKECVKQIMEEANKNLYNYGQNEEDMENYPQQFDYDNDLEEGKYRAY